MRTYLLLDGIQLGATDIAAHLPGGKQVYKDLAEVAGLAGPVLIESHDEIERLVKHVEHATPRRFATAYLKSETGLESVAVHLRAVRYFRPNSSREQFFLRYADTRVFTALMKVLDGAQKRALFGPVSVWTVFDREGRSVGYLRPDGPLSSSAPLSLSNNQHLELLRMSRPDQLLADVIEDNPDLARVGSEAERHRWARKALEFVESHRARSFAYRLAVGAVAVRTRGEALSDPGFIEAFRASMTKQDGANQVHEWAPVQNIGDTNE